MTDHAHRVTWFAPDRPVEGNTVFVRPDPEAPMTDTPATTTDRPWDTADDWSMWEITGQYPTAGHSFTACLAVVLPRYTHGTDRPLFVFVGPLADLNDPVDPAWITGARPLLLVDQDDPALAYWEHDQPKLAAARRETQPAPRTLTGVEHAHALDLMRAALAQTDPGPTGMYIGQLRDLLGPPAVGRCGAPTPDIGLGGRTEHCTLLSGHAGWHRGDGGCEWGETAEQARRAADGTA